MVLGVVALLWTLAGASALAQDATPPSRPPGATLEGWADRVHIALRDKRHAHGGLFYDRGVLRRLTPAMDHEYALDLELYGYTLRDDAQWYAAPLAFRTHMGSIHRSRFATASHFRNRIALRPRHTVTLTGLLQEDLSAERAFVEVGYQYQTGAHQLGFRQTVGSYKPDLDFGFNYAFASPTLGNVRVEATVLDLANNFIFDTLGADPVLEDTVRSYRRAPRYVTAQWMSPTWRRLRAEFHLGLQPRARADVHAQSQPHHRFTWEDQFHMMGGLVEADLSAITAGAIYRETRSRIRRTTPTGSAFTSDFTTAQTSRTVSAYVLARIWTLDLEAWGHLETYRDRQDGTDFDQASLDEAMNYREHRTALHIRLGRVPPDRGLRLALDYLLDSRGANDDIAVMNRYLSFPHYTPNGRFALQVGYAFSRRAYVIVGAAFDAGGDPFYGDRGLTRYDGGFGRVVVTT